MLGNFSEHNRPGAQIDDIFTALYQVPSRVFPVKTKNEVWGGSTIYSNNPIALISVRDMRVHKIVLCMPI